MALRNLTMMSAVLWGGVPFQVSVGRVPVPTLQSETDVIVRVTAAAICGTDLHIYRGTYGSSGPVNPPTILGHEGMGIVSEVGSAVTAHKVGDYVVIPDRIDNTHLQMEPEPYIAFGTPNLPGSQAEYVRVPAADFNLIPIPAGSNGSEPSLDYLFLSDIFPTAWTAVDYSGFQPGDTVAIFGAGPVGLLTAYSALLRGAAKVYAVDSVPSRLALAESIGAIPISFNASDPVQQILAREPSGVRRAIDCVGYEAVNADLLPQSDIILQNMVAVTGRNGGIGIAGVYTGGNGTTSPPINIGELWGKAVSVQMGAVNPVLTAPLLEDLVSSGKARPSFIVSKEASIEEAPDMYARFEQHLESKVVFRFK